MSVKIQWAEPQWDEGKEIWATFIEAETDAEALEQLVAHCNDRDAIADVFKIERN